ncbi:MAG: addiction module protein [Saprospiraceae bacterium]
MSDLIQEISKLTVGERIQLVQAILQTISDNTSEDDFLLSSAHVEEIERRSAEIASGSVKTIAWEDIQAKLAERHGL